MRKTQTIQMRMSPVEKEALQRAAKQYGVSMAEIVSNALLHNQLFNKKLQEVLKEKGLDNGLN